MFLHTPNVILIQRGNINGCGSFDHRGNSNPGRRRIKVFSILDVSNFSRQILVVEEERDMVDPHKTVEYQRCPML